MTTRVRTLAATTLGGASCPVCGAITRRAADLGDFRLHACAACGSWSSDALVRGATTSFQPQAYFDHAEDERPRWETLRQAIQPLAPRSVLDVGCGGGEYLAWTTGAFAPAQATGIELDTGRARRAAERNPRATILTGDALAVAEGLGGDFDLITLWDVLEHVPEPARLLKALAQRLTPRGRLFVQTINEASIVPRIGRWSYRLTAGALKAGMRRTHDAHHLVFFTRPGLWRMGQEAGLAPRREWFGRLSLARMDGPKLLTVPTACLLATENWFGGGLFVNVLFSRADCEDPGAGKEAADFG
ncbi:MAG: class I SAM-dependent methyltransferase [Gammaproteobacteria bacterium]|nr:class I SAM-dependent methyltransferase [Gammaproteobacteria bacterium]